MDDVTAPTALELARRILNAEKTGAPGPFLPPSELVILARAVIEAAGQPRLDPVSVSAIRMWLDLDHDGALPTRLRTLLRMIITPVSP